MYYEMSLDAQKVSRSVYTYFDALGNVGGLNGILISVTVSILAVLNTNKDQNHLVSKLYTRDKNTRDLTLPAP